MADLPPLPEGFQLVQPKTELPPLPDGYQLNGDYSKNFGAPKPAPTNIVPPKELSTLETFYRKVRPYIAPPIEITGAVVGGMAGTPVGPAGNVAGAGLGYGMAKGLVRAGDIYLGGYDPPLLSTQIKNAVGDVGEGAAMEVLGQTGGKVIAKGLGKVNDWWNLPRLRSAQILQDAAETGKTVNKQELQRLLKGAGQSLERTTGQVTASVDNPAWQALMDRSGSRDPAYLNSVLKAQEKQSLSEFGRLTPGETQTGARTAMDELKDVLTQRTTPIREQALQAANVGKVNIQSLKGSIQNIPTNPNFAANDIIEGASNDIASELAKWADPKTGVIDAEALYAIRKNAVDAAIAKLRPGADIPSQKKLAAGVMAEIKPLIDDAIEGAGGTGWRDYLKTYETGMRDINQKKLTGKAFDLWKQENQQPFVDLVTGEKPKAVEKILGPGRYDINAEIGPSFGPTGPSVGPKTQLDVLMDEVNKVKTNQSMKEQASSGGEALTALMQRHSGKWRMPQILQREVMLANRGLDMLEKKLGEKTTKILTEVSQNPALADYYLDFLPAAERNSVLRYLSHPEAFGPKGKLGSTGVVTYMNSDKEQVP